MDADDDTSDWSSETGSCNSEGSAFADAKELKITPLLDARMAGSFAEAATMSRQGIIADICNVLTYFIYKALKQEE